MINYQKINIAFRAPEDFESKVIKLSQEIGNKNNSYFILDGINYYPHITIYSSIFSESNLSNILEKIEIFVKKLDDVSFKFKGVGVGQGYIGFNFINSNKIKKIHQGIVELLNPLRKNISEDDLKDYNLVFNKKQKKSISEYGYPDAMNLYVPHMTITRLKDEKTIKNITREIKWNVGSFKVGRIACCLMGDNGVCKQIIKEFELHSNEV